MNLIYARNVTIPNVLYKIFTYLVKCAGIDKRNLLFKVEDVVVVMWTIIIKLLKIPHLLEFPWNLTCMQGDCKEREIGIFVVESLHENLVSNNY